MSVRAFNRERERLLAIARLNSPDRERFMAHVKIYELGLHDD